MSWSGFALIRPGVSEEDFVPAGFSEQCQVERTEDGFFDVLVSGSLLGNGGFGPRLWLVICKDVLNSVQNKTDLSFRELIWGWHDLDGEATTGLLNAWNSRATRSVEYLSPLEELDDNFNVRVDDNRIVFGLSPEQAKRSYLCLEFDRPVIDGGLFATFDLPAFAGLTEDKNQ